MNANVYAHSASLRLSAWDQIALAGADSSGGITAQRLWAEIHLHLPLFARIAWRHGVIQAVAQADPAHGVPKRVAWIVGLDGVAAGLLRNARHALLNQYCQWARYQHRRSHRSLSGAADDQSAQQRIGFPKMMYHCARSPRTLFCGSRAPNGAGRC